VTEKTNQPAGTGVNQRNPFPVVVSDAGAAARFQNIAVSSASTYLPVKTVEGGNRSSPVVTSVNLQPHAKPVATKRKNGRATPMDVARYLVYLASCEEEPDFLSHLRLQKLLYYVQGWSLAMRNKPMFDGRIEAWAHGPVVRDLYPQLNEFGRRPISVEDIGLPQNLTEDEFEFVASVWESYKKFSASSLREMTHKESPWVDARGGCGPADRSDSEITLKAMKEFFSKQAG
jgi:uncharacterized phage-associated protein